MDDGDPATAKTWRALDAAVSGEWEISVGMDLANTDTAETAAIVDQTTYSQERIPLIGESTHISVRFRSRGTGPAVVGACAVRYDVERAAAHSTAAPKSWAAAYPGTGDLTTARVWLR